MSTSIPMPDSPLPASRTAGLGLLLILLVLITPRLVTADATVAGSGTPEVDLAVSISESADPVIVVTDGNGGGESPQTYIATVTNLGPSDASGVVLDFSLPTVLTGVIIEDVIPSVGTIRPLTWILGNLAAGDSETLTLETTFLGSGSPGIDVFEFGMSVAAVAETDTDPRNDSDAEATSVEHCSLLVNRTDDTGDGSLRRALECANLSPTAANIFFEIPGTGPHTISPLSALPPLTQRVFLDGRSQDGYVDTPVVVLDGQLAGDDVDAVRFESTGNFVFGLAFTEFSGSALVVSSPDSTGNLFVENSYFGNGGLAIDLGGDGPTPNDPNDADTGANRLLNTPVIERAAATDGGLEITYRVDSDPANHTFPLTVLFSIADADGNEGQTFLGADNYTEGDHGGCSSPPCAKTFTLMTDATPAALVAHTVDSDLNTSEFATASPSLEATKVDVVVGGAPAPSGSTIRYTVTLSNVGTGPASGVVFTDTPATHTSLVADSGAITGATGASFDYAGGVLRATLDAPLPGFGASVEISFDVTVDSPLPSSVDAVCNQGTVTADGARSVLTDDPDVGGTADMTCTTIAENILPTVASVDSVSATQDGLIKDHEAIARPITQLAVAFSEDVNGGDAVAAFRVIAAGADGIAETTTCAGGLIGDDVLVPIVSVAYANTTSRLGLSTGPALTRGEYHLVVCGGTITDLSGDALDGDGDGAAGDDFVRRFTISTDHLLTNPNFDDVLAPWSSLDYAWNTEDVDQAPTSGSAMVVLPDAERSLEHPCVDVAGETGLGARIAARIFDPSLGSPTVSLTLVFFDGAGCAGTSLGSASLAPIMGDTGLDWKASFGWTAVPGGAVSALPTLHFSDDGASPNEVLIDRATLTPMIFGDGFETGDTSGWSDTTP